MTVKKVFDFKMTLKAIRCHANLIRILVGTTSILVTQQNQTLINAIRKT